MQGPSDPRPGAGGKSYGSRGAEPRKSTGTVGPQARGGAHIDRARTASGGANHIAVGGMKPSAKGK